MLKTRVIIIILSFILGLSPLVYASGGQSRIAGCLYTEGKNFYDKGMFKEAIKEFKKALLVEPGNSLAQAYLEKAQIILGAMRILAEDNIDFVSVQYEEPGEKESRKYRDLKKKFQRLEKKYKETIALRTPESSNELTTKEDIYRTLGYLYSIEGNEEKSIGFYEKALKFNPDDKEVHYNLAYFYTQKGEYKKAVRSYKKALKKDDSDEDVYYNLAIIFGKYLKDERESNRYYEKFLECQ